MRASKSKRLFLSAVLILIWLPASVVLSYLSVVIFPSMGASLDDSIKIGLRIGGIIDIFVFGNCAWNMRENKRLLLPLCLYIVVQIIVVIFPQNIVVVNRQLPVSSIIPLIRQVLKSVFLMLFYTSFCRHPESSIRISSILTSVSKGINTVCELLYVLTDLSHGLFGATYMNIPTIVSLLQIIDLVFSMLFWTAFIRVMKKITNA